MQYLNKKLSVEFESKNGVTQTTESDMDVSLEQISKKLSLHVNSVSS